MSQTITASRKQEEKKQRRKTIMHAALLSFAEKGYVKTNMDEIAKKAQLSVGALYNFFPNKDELYLATIKIAFQEFVSLLQKTALEEGDFSKIIYKLFRLHLCCNQYQRFFQSFMEAILGGIITQKPIFFDQLHIFYVKYIELLEDLFLRFEASVKNINPHYLSLTFFGLVKAKMIHWMHFQNPALRNEEMLDKEIVDLSNHFLLMVGTNEGV